MRYYLYIYSGIKINKIVSFCSFSSSPRFTAIASSTSRFPAFFFLSIFCLYISRSSFSCALCLALSHGRPTSFHCQPPQLPPRHLRQAGVAKATPPRSRPRRQHPHHRPRLTRRVPDHSPSRRRLQVFRLLSGTCSPSATRDKSQAACFDQSSSLRVHR